MNVAIEELAAVGEKTGRHFRDLGIVTAQDLLDDLPFRYEDQRFATPSAKLLDAGGEATAVGLIVAVKERRVRDLEIVEARLEDESGSFTAKWIGRRRFVVGRFHEGMRLFVRGRVERSLAGPVINVSGYGTLAASEAYRGEVLAVYHATADLSSRKIAQVVKKNLPRLLQLIGDDPLPADLREKYGFAGLHDSYRDVHAPATPEAAAKARERFIYTEFLALAAIAQRRRSEREREHVVQALELPADLLQALQSQLPFDLTAAQLRVMREIWSDMARQTPMNRLLQGDVGSGKTLVAAAAMLLAARNGVQSALMAPTEILALQHAAKLAPLLLPFGIAVEVILGSQGQRARNSALDRLADGSASVVIGTHALLTEGVDFARLGFVVIDEQQRFGVEQRARLRAKGGTPHTLHMTATPIPRTLAQSVYADLDVSTIDELPPGRTPIETFAVRRSRMPLVEDFVRRSIALGQQAYIVAPAIDESDAGLTSALVVAERLAEDAFKGLRVGLLHGQLPSRDKENAMERFAAGETDVLVATTVVEVGVDVANASVMVVLDADRYGLAQLHQLRGRVGRGAAKSYCVLVAPDDAGEVERLAILTRSTDGFFIAEEDLRLRGPGQFSGTIQAGAAQFKIADLVRDINIYRSAKEDAQRIIARDPELTSAPHRGLRALVEEQPSARALIVSS